MDMKKKVQRRCGCGDKTEERKGTTKKKRMLRLELKNNHPETVKGFLERLADYLRKDLKTKNLTVKLSYPYDEYLEEDDLDPNGYKIQIKDNTNSTSYNLNIIIPSNRETKVYTSLLEDLEYMGYNVRTEPKTDVDDTTLDLPFTLYISRKHNILQKLAEKKWMKGGVPEKKTRSVSRLARMFQPYRHPLLETPEIDEKKKWSRQELLQYLHDFCGGSHTTTILSSDIDDMKVNELLQLRRLNKKHCYTINELFHAMREAENQNTPFLDPMTRVAISPDVRKQILQQYKRLIDPKAQLLQNRPELDEKRVELMLFPEDNFYHIGIRINDDVMDLGYIPDYSNPQDLSENTGTLLVNLQELWKQRRLLSTHSPIEAIECCRIHLRKPKEYWINSQTGQVDPHRFRLMFEEIKSLLD